MREARATKRPVQPVCATTRLVPRPWAMAPMDPQPLMSPDTAGAASACTAL